MDIIKTLWAYRGFIIGNVKREFQSKYRHSLLGVAWTIINPLAQILIYTVIFSQIMRAKLPGIDSTFAYSIYLCAGIITWGLFAEIIGRGQNIFLENANLLKKLNFPRLCLPITVVATALINFGIIFSLFTIFLIITGNFPGWSYLALIPVITTLVTFAVGLGITIGILNVFFRDIGYFFTIFLTFWFWLTPIVYPLSILPTSIQQLIKLNPMTGIISACQNILVHNQPPDWYNLSAIATLSLLLCMFGISLFRKRAGEMVDEL